MLLHKGVLMFAIYEAHSNGMPRMVLWNHLGVGYISMDKDLLGEIAHGHNVAMNNIEAVVAEYYGPGKIQELK